MEGMYDIDLVGTIYRWQSLNLTNITNIATWELKVYHKCNNPATKLKDSLARYTLNYKAGDPVVKLLTYKF
jgi:hypothetical protein